MPKKGPYVSKRTTYWVLVDSATQQIVTAGGSDSVQAYRTHSAAEVALARVIGLAPTLEIKRAVLHVIR